MHEVEAKVEEIFNEVDFNNDGSINYSEFLTVTMKKERMLSIEMLKKAFNMFDLDGNGYITVNELMEVIPMGDAQFSWKNVIEEVDTDGDGQVTLY